MTDELLKHQCFILKPFKVHSFFQAFFAADYIEAVGVFGPGSLQNLHHHWVLEVFLGG